MSSGLTPHRVASAAFLIVLVALLIVPVGSAGRAAQTHATAGQAHGKAVAPAVRSTQVAAPLATDHFQLDPTTPADEVVEMVGQSVTVEDFTPRTMPVGAALDSTSRGPPAL